MRTDDPVIDQLAAADPASGAPSPDPRDRAEADRILARILAGPQPRPPRRRRVPGILAPAASLLVVVAVAAVVLRTGGSSTSGSATNRGLSVILTALPTPQTPRVTAEAMSREVELVRRRLESVAPHASVTRVRATLIAVTAPGVTPADRARIVRLITQPAQLRFYDWEANVLLPDGKTDASELGHATGPAVALSQGTGKGAGFAGPGSMPLYFAVKIAATQAPRPKMHAGRTGSQYYLFGAPGSAACAAAARAEHSAYVRGTHCLLAGPLDVSAEVSARHARAALITQVPAGVGVSGAQELVVPQGTAVIQAQTAGTAHPGAVSDPGARFFILRDEVALTGNAITHPRASTDQSGAPDITFGFTRAGQAAFEKVTRIISRRGADVSVDGLTLDQHFAVVLDDRLLTVPQIDFRQYPDGIIGTGGADIAGGFTRQTARDLATLLRYGALPLALRVAH